MGESRNCSAGPSAAKAGHPPRASASDGRRVEPAARDHRRPGWTLYRLVAKEALTPTFLALFGLTAVVLTQNLLELSDLFVNRGLSGGTVSLIAFYQAIPTATLMLPFAVLMGCLVALGRMGADLEILALEASGVTAARLVWPFVAFASVMTLLSAGLSLSGAPWTSRALDRVFATIALEKPWSQVQRGVVTHFGDWRIEAREVNARGDQLKGILLWLPEVGQTVFARSGRVDTLDDGTTEISLQDGRVVLSTNNRPKTLTFDELTTRLPESGDMLRSGKDELFGLTLTELSERARDFMPRSPRQLSRPAIEYHRRFAMPLATLIFGVLAVPLFLVRTNFSRAAGGVVGLLCTIAYYGLIQLGEGLAQSQLIGVTAAVWLPNASLSLLAGVLIVRARREGVLGHSFDRRQHRTSRSANRKVRERRPRRYPLPRYVAGRFIRLATLSFAILLVAYLLIDIMDRLAWFSQYRATGLEILHFYGARVVLLASRVIPMSLLVAAALTVSLLAVEGELIGMRSCGISAPSALLPVLIISAFVVPADAVLNNVLVPRANALADELKHSEIKGGKAARQLDERRKNSVWYRMGNKVLEAERFDPDRGSARDLSIYEIGEDRLPVRRIDASAARHVGNGWWLLTDPVQIDISEGKVRTMPPPNFANLGEALPAEVDTMHMSVGDLIGLIEEAENDNVDPRPLRVDYHVKLAQPLACIVLPALLLFFAVGGPPFPGPAQTLLLSAVVGIGYILLTGVSRSLGYGGVMPPIVGGWGPILIFLAIATFFGMRLWRRL
jgi:LPS export ABC transporter permease LptG/LPS export ABC transporter permease LptF